MIFVELAPFAKFREQHLPDDEFSRLQSFLIAIPTAGDLIRGGAGLRKLRWAGSGRGKRGGARVIYYLDPLMHRIYLLYGYVKSRRENLSRQQIRVLTRLLKE